jgi:hypothetical protein
MYRTTYDESKGLGEVIREKQLELEKRQVKKNELVILIKPGNEASFRDFVAVLDEMFINNLTRYAVVDQEKEEAAYLDQSK